MTDSPPDVIYAEPPIADKAAGYCWVLPDQHFHFLTKYIRADVVDEKVTALIQEMCGFCEVTRDRDGILHNKLKELLAQVSDVK